LARKKAKVPWRVADLHLSEAALLGGRKFAYVPSQLGHRPELLTVLLVLAREPGGDRGHLEPCERGPFLLARQCSTPCLDFASAAERDFVGSYLI
jgi:hypothetical protein